jgi:hypothetical protein
VAERSGAAGMRHTEFLARMESALGSSMPIFLADQLQAVIAGSNRPADLNLVGVKRYALSLRFLCEFAPPVFEHVLHLPAFTRSTTEGSGVYTSTRNPSRQESARMLHHRS